MGKRATLFDHPNWELSPPKAKETQIQYTLRCAAELLSPPKYDDEDEDIECTNAAFDIQKLEIKIKSAWKNRVR